MRRLLAACALVVALTAASRAHFVFVVPDATGEKLTVVFSDTLDPDEGVPVTKIAGLKLITRDAGGKEGTLALQADKAALVGKLAGTKPTQVFGSVRYGAMKKGNAKPYLLVYHPRAIIGTLDAMTALGDKVPAELLAASAGKGVRFRLLAAGKPVADTEVNVIKPDGDRAKVTTGKDGWTPAVEGTGRFGAWARFVESAAGEHNGVKYEEIRHYPTLVVQTAAKR